jgi:hypothetical protein
MKHQRVRDIQKILNRKRMWDKFRWGYNNQPHRLFKHHWLKDGCSHCQYEQYLKYHQHRIQRLLDKKVIEEQLMEL